MWLKYCYFLSCMYLWLDSRLRWINALEIGISVLFTDSLFLLSSGVGVLMTSPLYEAPSLHRVLEDRIFPQNLPSIICGHVLSPQPGQTVLDMCAAPGEWRRIVSINEDCFCNLLPPLCNHILEKSTLITALTLGQMKKYGNKFLI